MRQKKLILIVMALIYSYVVIHHISNEVYFQRYPNIFISYIELVLHNHIATDIYSPLPMFFKTTIVTPDWPSTITRIIATESYFQNYTNLFLISHYLLNLTPQQLIVIPIGIIFVPVLCLALSKRLIPNNTPRYIPFFVLSIIYMLIYLASTKNYGSFYVAPPTFALLITILLLVIIYFTTTSNIQKVVFVLILISIISLARYWHTYLFFSLFFIISVCCCFIVVNCLKYLFPLRIEGPELNMLTRKSIQLLIPTSICSVVFTQLWDSNYLSDTVESISLLDYLDKAIVKFFGGNPYAIPYSFDYKDLFWGEIYFQSRLTLLFVASLILLIPLLLKITDIFKQRKIRIDFIFVLGLSVVIAQIIAAVAYYNATSVNFFYVPILFPLFGTALFLKLGLEKKFLFKSLGLGLLITLVVLACMLNIALFMTNEMGTTSITQYSDTETSYNWLNRYTSIHTPIITDFNVLGKYLQREVETSVPQREFQYISSQTFGLSVCANKQPPSQWSGSIVVYDHATMSKGLPIHTMAARALFKPLLASIEASPNQNKIYMDKYASIYMFN